MNIGKKLQAARLKEKLSQDEVAEKLNITRQTLSNWENNKSYPDILYVLELSELYSLSLDELIKDDKEMLNHIKDNSSLIKTKERNKNIFMISTYLIIWAVAILMFWLFTGEGDAMGYSLMTFFCVLPITTFVISFLIGRDKNWELLKYFMPIFFGVMYMIAEYATFSLANMTSFDKFNLPSFELIITGAVISYIGIVIGLLTSKLKRKK